MFALTRARPVARNLRIHLNEVGALPARTSNIRTVSSTAGKTTRSGARYVVAGVAVAIGAAIGYTLGSRSQTETSVLPIASVPVYGTSEDFKSAIAELQKLLPEDMVTDDEDVLHQHGFSTNDYHPGE